MQIYAIDASVVTKQNNLLDQHLECERRFRYLIDVYNDLIEEGLLNKKKINYNWFSHPFLVKSEGYFDLCDFLGVQHLFMNRSEMEEKLWLQIASEHRILVEKFQTFAVKERRTNSEEIGNTPYEFAKSIYEKNKEKLPKDRLNWIDTVFKDTFYEIERNDFTSHEDLVGKFIISTKTETVVLFAFNQLVRYLSPFELCRIESIGDNREKVLAVEDGTKVLLPSGD